MLCASLRPPLEKGERCACICECVCVCDISAFEVISGMASARQSRHFNQQLLEESSFSVHFIFPISLCHSSVRFVPFRWRWLHLRDNAHTHTHNNSHTARQRDRQTLELPSFTPALVAAVAHQDNDNDDEGDTSIIFCCSNVEISSQRLKCTLVLSLPAVGSTPNSAPVPTVTPPPPLRLPLPGPSNLLNHTSN